MARAWRGGRAMVVGRGRGDGFSLGNRLDHLLTERRVLSALEVGDSILGAAEAQFHVVGIFAGELKGPLEAAEGVYVVAEDDVVGRLLVVVVEVAPCGDEFAAVGLGDACVDLCPLDAGRRVGAPQGRSLAAANPAGSPAALRDVVVKGGEVGIGGAVVATVVENGQFFGAPSEKRIQSSQRRFTPLRRGATM